MHPSKAVYHVSEPIVYIVDKNTNKMTKFNYITAQAKTINLNEVPQAMAYSNNELYLLYKDKLSIIDANSLKVKKSFDGILKSFDKGVLKHMILLLLKMVLFLSHTQIILLCPIKLITVL